MSRQQTGDERRFVRSSDDAMLGGVCAGLANYFGFNRKATRVLAVVGFFINPLFAVGGYLAIVMLVPAQATASRSANRDPAFQKTVRSAPANAMGDLRRRFQSLDRRLARLERYVTSSRYQLDREFRELER